MAANGWFRESSPKILRPRALTALSLTLSTHVFHEQSPASETTNVPT